MIAAIMPWDRLALFIGAELVFSLTPGPTVLMISAYGFQGGWRAALPAICGTQTGNTIWYAVCVAGLGAIVAASPLAFRIIALLGAAYLIWLGASSLWHSFHAPPGRESPRLRANPYWQAVLTQLGNPKALLFFGALLPGCLTMSLPLGPQYLVMYVVTLTGESVILTAYAALAVTGGRAAATRHAVWQERIIGAVLIGLGALFALHP